MAKVGRESNYSLLHKSPCFQSGKDKVFITAFLKITCKISMVSPKSRQRLINLKLMGEKKNAIKNKDPISLP